MSYSYDFPIAGLQGVLVSPLIDPGAMIAEYLTGQKGQTIFNIIPQWAETLFLGNYRLIYHYLRF